MPARTSAPQAIFGLYRKSLGQCSNSEQELHHCVETVNSRSPPNHYPIFPLKMELARSYSLILLLLSSFVCACCCCNIISMEGGTGAGQPGVEFCDIQTRRQASLIGCFLWSWHQSSAQVLVAARTCMLCAVWSACSRCPADLCMCLHLIT